MYTPKHFEETRTGELHRLIGTHPLATLIIQVDGELIVNHLPMLISGDGEFGSLCAHIARANPLSHHLKNAINAVAVFQGAQAYVSPNWYPSKHADGKQVPTWNYAVVHAHGCPRLIDDPAWLYAHLNEMTNKQEAPQSQPWKVSDAPPEFIDKMMMAIVGLEMPIARLEGKWKVSQNRIMADQLGVAAGLQANGDLQSRAMAGLVMQHLKTEPAT